MRQEGASIWFVVGHCNLCRRIDSYANVLIIVAVLSEDVLQENQLCMKAVLITCSLILCTSGKYGMLIGWMVVRTRVEVEVGVSMFTVYLMTQTASRSPVNKYVQEAKVVIFSVSMVN
jgi:hypothetical protein